MSDSEASSKASSGVEPVTCDLINSLAKYLVPSPYACGGTIKVHEVATEGCSLPVTIRWDTKGSIEKLSLPFDPTVSSDSELGLQTLLSATEPASFGFQGKDVIDESYRKATKLDSTAFSTTFCPYVVGIIDILGRTLLPQSGDSSRSIKAELYKLNVYEAPSGLFKPHVDTPRSDLQFGSLVVCLPSKHKGGQLVVRHQEHSTTFDWSGDGNDIHWAAFYSDCEHEVMQVTNGHRITLTYNLFVRHSIVDGVNGCALPGAPKFPVHEIVKSALANPDFFPQGGIIGKYCTHAYAHATSAGIRSLPRVLKGSDMVTYEVFRSLGVWVGLRSIIDLSRFEGELEEDYCQENLVSRLSEPEILENYEEEERLEQIFEGSYSHDKFDIKWLNVPTREMNDLQIAFLRYGNQAEVDFAYSFCALLIEIPSYAERVKIAKQRGYSSED
ncbi:hypothetical protein GQ44DRAFT_657499 [Phaeosphaeriaceae sp. PMI808]|nr:hypothetical protein GQ44DRAFT_657499 [Phaeosphaeriaceae sp. PMI808]